MPKEQLSGGSIGRYRIVSRLGRGGMGEVYLAEDGELERKVALKLLLPEVAADEERVRRFVQEAKAASALNHPNILTVHEIGVVDSSRYIVTEYIKGETLRDRIASEPLTLREMLDVTLQVAAALSAAHGARIVHRDIKPENIMLRDDGFVKVLDFGLAKLSGTARQTANSEDATRAQVNTAPGAVMGTADYMSPEQARGKETDGRTDVWSLGVVLFEMHAGKSPFKGETTNDTIAAILTREPPPLDASVPHELHRIIKRALQKNPNDRYQTVQDFLLDVRDLKRELEFSEELERSHIPALARSASVGITASEDIRTATHAAGLSTQNSLSHQPSSAEYVVGEVKKHKIATLAFLIVLVLGTAGFGYWYLNRPSAAIGSVAVLPFANAGGDPNFEYISDGLSEAIINNLSQLAQLKVISRSSAWKYKGKEVDLAEVAKALGVGAIVMGRVVPRGDNLQISVEMVNAADGTQIFGEQFTRKAADLQAVQSEISRVIADKLRLRLTGEQQSQLAKKPTQNPAAYHLYLDAVYHTRKTGAADQKKALEYLTKAVELDPSFALAYAKIATAYTNLGIGSFMNPKEARAKSHEAVEKALSLDDALPDAHYSLASLKLSEWDWAGAEKAYRRAIELDPNYFVARLNYAIFLSDMGRIDEALEQVSKAQELEPLLPNPRRAKARILAFNRRYDEALILYGELAKLDANDVSTMLGLAYTHIFRGQYSQAFAPLQKVMSIDGENPSDLCYLGVVNAGSGQRAEALRILDKLQASKEYVSPVELSHLHSALGDREKAFELLEKGYAARDPQMRYLKAEPIFDPLRSDPRFADLLRRVGLAP